jgi:arginyl-tRNA synthetase
VPVERLRAEIARSLAGMGVAEQGEIPLERPRNPEHGDWSTSVALGLARTLGRKPREIAETLVERLDLSSAGVRAVEIAGPGFINFRLMDDVLWDGLRQLLEAGSAYGRSHEGGGERVVVEFVSANPTGPLHIGHGRQAALGDAVTELLAWTGWEVSREFYYNDAGEQIARLARSVWARYQTLTGTEVEFPEDGYHGEYVTEIARSLIGEIGDRFAGDDSPAALDFLRERAVAALRAEQNRDLGFIRVHFDHFFLESSLYGEGKVEETVARLRETGLVYEQEGALWLRTTDFGDDKDRVMVKSSGHPTYFLPDVAYHLTKWERGFRRAVNVQGADHHGTVARVRAGLRALGLPEGYPEYVLHQMVLVTRGGQEVKFSKRAGDYVTMRELCEEVGVDVARYFFLMRRADAQLTFDMDLALEHSDRNPVYKVQYAHARMCSILRRSRDLEDHSVEADLTALAQPAEQELAKLLLRFPEVVGSAAEQFSPHSVCEYLEKLAGAVNSWYHEGNLRPELRVLGGSVEETRARLLLSRAVIIVLRNGLTLLGITAPERMERAAEPE